MIFSRLTLLLFFNYEPPKLRPSHVLVVRDSSLTNLELNLTSTLCYWYVVNSRASVPTTSDTMTMPMQVSLPLAMYLRIPVKYEKSSSEVSRPLYLPLRSYILLDQSQPNLPAITFHNNRKTRMVSATRT